MALNPNKHLEEASPRVEDEEVDDVEVYPLPDSSAIEDDYAKEVWDEAKCELEEDDEEEEDEIQLALDASGNTIDGTSADTVDIQPASTLISAGNDGGQQLVNSRLDFPNDAPNSDNLTLPERVHVYCDWDTLKSCVVGRCEHDVIPRWYPSFESGDSNEVDDPKATGKTKAEYCPENYDKCIRQLDHLCELLEKEGVQVFRPDLLPLDYAKADPVGLSQNWVREAFMAFDNKIVLGQMRTPHRNKDRDALEPLLKRLTDNGLCSVHNLPSCTFEKNSDWKNDPRPFLEGGDVFRLGKDVLVTISYLASSPAGYRYLKELLEPDIEVWPAYMTKEWEHGDYIFMPVREGLCIAFLQGFTDGILPSPISDWDCIALTYSEANDKFAANGIALREDCVILPQGCSRVVRQLERKGIDVIEVPFDGVYYWQGAVDCSVSELWRE